MKDVGAALLSIVAGVLGLAIVAVIVSKQANTSSVIQSAGTGFSSIIQAAVAPVSSGMGYGAQGFL